MNPPDILTVLSQEKECELITSWRGIPIRVKLPIKWVSTEKRLVSLDLKDCKFKSVFSGENPVYMKVNEVFLSCRIFSNISNELVLEIEAPVPLPSIVLRENIRVQPKETEPVYVSFYVENECILKAKVADISESGVGIHVHEKDVGKLFYVISNIVKDAQKIGTKLEIYIELPTGEKIKTSGELKNVIEKDGYLRVGFKISLSEEDKKRIRRYIMRREMEILEQLKFI
ncbi:MAG: PilZ domain-containing protein [Aquificaceae bacterium]